MEKVTDLHLSVEKFFKICRLCVQEENDLHPIGQVMFSSPNKEELHLADVLRSYANIEVDNLNLPLNVCNKCVMDLYKSYTFIERCKQSDKMLHSLLELSDANQNKSYTQQYATNSNHSFKQQKLDEITEICDDNEYKSSEVELKTIMKIDDIKKKNISKAKFNLKGLQLKSKLRLNKETKHDKIKRKQTPNKFGKSGELEVFVCSFCEMSYQNVKSLKLHEDTFGHTTQCITKQCQYCTFKCDNGREFKIHVSQHQTFPWKCNICLRKFKSEITYKKHVESHTMNCYTYSCGYCKLETTNVTEYEDHVKRHDVEETIISYNIDSVEIDKISSNLIEIFHCEICGSNFEKKSLLSRHAKLIHNISSRNLQNNSFDYNTNSNGLFACPFCQKMYTTEEIMKNHARCHTETEPDDVCYQCNICLKTFTENKILEEHFKYHEEKLANCEIDNNIGN